MLSLNKIQVTLGKNGRMPNRVLNNLDLSIAAGEFVVIVGSNGSGKSTLFNTMAGYIEPDSGSVFIDKQNVTRQSAMERSALVALVMQDPRLGTMENMTLEENLNIAYRRGQSRKLLLHNTTKRRTAFKERLSKLNMNLEDRLDELVVNLSGGQRQALSLIMAMMADYKILLLDEITAALDPRTADNVMSIADKLVREEKHTAIMITHNMRHALLYGTRILVMAGGQIIREYNAGNKQTLSAAALAADIGAI